MDFELAKRFGTAVRKVFGDITPLYAEDEHGEVWVNKDQEVHSPDTDVRVRALPDFHDWRE